MAKPPNASGGVACFNPVRPLVLGEVEVTLDVQQHLPEEAQPLLLKLLALVEHLLHVLHVLGGALAQLVQRFLVLLLGLVGSRAQRSLILWSSWCQIEREDDVLTFCESCLHLSTFSWSFFCWSAVTDASVLLLASRVDASFSSLQAMW